MKDTELTREQRDRIAQVAATMAIEDMPLTEQSYADLRAMVTGQRGEDDLIAEAVRRHKHG